ncbi:hypothetical protein F5X68DRAFT_237731 [Plectosphaerella plurivora]|uniref:Uncharacterized protein n=1 Tax=Plectosphaerella plurivora TaxID=936078 RepID=A0A9P8V182_9PEZI|nr:hypothetical protein F5X68DRAFT_237731 [Plectosphaerella plurivora]
MTQSTSNQDNSTKMASEHTQVASDSSQCQSHNSEDHYVVTPEERDAWVGVLETQPRKERVLPAPEIEMAEADAKAFMKAESPATSLSSAEALPLPEQAQALTRPASPAKAISPPTPELTPGLPGAYPCDSICLPPPAPVSHVPWHSEAALAAYAKRNRKHDEQARKNRGIAASRPPRHLRPTPLSMVADPVVSAAQSGSSMAVGFLRRQIGLEDRTGYQLIPQDDPNSPRLIEEGWYLPDEEVTVEEKKVKKDIKGKGKALDDPIQDDWQEVSELYRHLPAREQPEPTTRLDRGMEIIDTAHATVVKGVNTAARVIFK